MLLLVRARQRNFSRAALQRRRISKEREREMPLYILYALSALGQCNAAATASVTLSRIRLHKNKSNCDVIGELLSLIM